MKKLLALLLALLVSSAMLAQGSRKPVNRNSFLAFHAGPSFPVGVFSSSYPSNDEAGFASRGYTIGINYGKRFKSGAGIAATGFYNQYPTKDLVLNIDIGDGTHTVVLSMDQWYMYGAAVGPSLEFTPIKNLGTGVHVMVGLAAVRLPAFYYDNEDFTKADWGPSGVIQAGMDLKMNMSKTTFIFINGEYQYMRPRFSLLNVLSNESEKVYQKVSVLHATAGIGFRF